MKKWDPSLEIVEGEKHRQYLQIAYDTAWKYSQDPDTQVGTIIIDSKLDKILAFGANHFPKNFRPTPEQLADTEWRIKNIIHSEPAAIINAAALGNSIDGMTMYMPWFPCYDCAKFIVDAGISELVGHRAMIDKTQERWFDSMNDSLKLLMKANVRCSVYEGNINNVKALFKGTIWYP